MGQVYEATKKREKLIKEAGYQLYTKWQCQWVAECRSNPKKKEFVEALDLTPRLDPRDAFYGGLVKTLIFVGVFLKKLVVKIKFLFKFCPVSFSAAAQGQ